MIEKELITVTGPIFGPTVGFMQSHEHLLISKGRSYEVSPVLYMDDHERSRAEVVSFKQCGGGSIADAQPVGCGRMCRGLYDISVATGVNILAATGFHKMKFYQDDHWIFSMSEDELTDLFSSELTQGMYDVCDYTLPTERTDIRAGFIKSALDSGEFSFQYQKVFAAAVNASLETNRALMVHIEAGSDPLFLLDFLIKRGIKPERIILCHTDRAVLDPSVRLELLNAGVFLEMDTIGRAKYHSDQREAEIFYELLSAGFEKQLLFSLDTTRARMKSYMPDGVGLCYLIRSFLPVLKDIGVTEEQIRYMSHANCIRAFGV